MLGVPSVNLHQDVAVVHFYLNKQKWAEDRTLWNTCQRLLFIIGEQHHVSQLDKI